METVLIGYSDSGKPWLTAETAEQQKINALYFGYCFLAARTIWISNQGGCPSMKGSVDFD